MVEEKVTLEKLAKLIQRGFEETATKTELRDFRKDVDERFQKVDERFQKVDDDINWIHGSLELLQREIADIKEKLGNVVYRHELEALRERITELERKTGFSAK